MMILLTHAYTSTSCEKQLKDYANLGKYTFTMNDSATYIYIYTSTVYYLFEANKYISIKIKIIFVNIKKYKKNYVKQ